MKPLLFVAALLAPACALASAVVPPTGPDGVDLVCEKGEKAPGTYRWDPATHSYRLVTADGATAAPDSALVLHLERTSGEIRLPDVLRTGAHAGGEQGWWVLEQLRQDEREIRARYRMSSTRLPELVINRADGRFVLKDDGLTLEGRCMPVTGRASAGL